MHPRYIISLIAVLLLLVAAGCNKQGKVRIKVSRFERILMDTPEDKLPKRLADFAADNPTPLLRILPDDEFFMQQVAMYRADSVVGMVDDTVKTYYNDLSDIERQLEQALQRAVNLDTAFAYRTFVTFISNAGYGSRVMADRESKSVAISIDEYVTPQMRPFGYFGEPLYLVRLCERQYIVPDCIAEIAKQHIALPESEMTMLDYIVAEGKVQYLLHEVLPSVHDTILLRYTPEQLAWMRTNEANVWAYFVQHKLLYCHDYAKLRNYVEDAPKTNAFQNSAPRTVAYIGYRMIKQYVKTTKISLSDLLLQTDAHEILSQSNYRP